MLCLTLQVAEQQGKYLARTFNALAKDPNAKIEPFSYKHMGSMASIGKCDTNMKTWNAGLCHILPIAYRMFHCEMHVGAKHSSFCCAVLCCAVLCCAVGAVL